MDESMVTQYPLVDITARVGEVNNVRYPMAGMTSHQVKVGIYNPATGKSIYLDAGDPTDRYFTNISWAPDEKSLYLIEVNRDQNHAKLCQYLSLIHISAPYFLSVTPVQSFEFRYSIQPSYACLLYTSRCV